jgi:outer membrane protein assembly factor BamE (lipoprotein component of BamABCDE complex)
VTESYRAPKEVDRKVLAIYFNENRLVRDVAIYGLEDGIIIPIVARTTETQGQELSVIGQIFSNLGRFGDGGSSADGL